VIAAPGYPGAGIFSRRGLFGSDVIIRTALPAELAKIGDIRVAAYQADGFLSATSRYASTLRGLGTVGDGDILVAVDDGQLLGTVMLQHWPHAGQVVRGPDEAEIRALAVAPGGRGKGTGRALVRAVIDRAASDGIRHLVLCTMGAMRTAHHLYEQAGFSRLPDRDWSPEPDVTLLVYGLVLTDRP
jgi:ribosomal protein S18 acetylase RimI-like enzyme